MENFTIDATGKKLGRVASEAAFALMGKNRTDYMPNAFPEVAVTITGANALDIGDKKAETKIYRTYSGYPSGLHERTLAKVGSEEALRIAIRGMLPPNKLRARRLTLLTIQG